MTAPGHHNRQDRGGHEGGGSLPPPDTGTGAAQAGFGPPLAPWPGHATPPGQPPLPGAPMPQPGQSPFHGGQFLPPPPPYAPGGTAGRSGGGRKRLLLIAGAAGVLVLALLAGLLFLGGGDDDGKTPAADGKHSAGPDPEALRPFRLAVASLAVAPGLRYKDDSPGGLLNREVTVTAGGSRMGSSGFGREELDREVLDVGGRTFTRWRSDPAAKDGEDKPSVWSAGSSADRSLTDELTAHRPAPPVLADQIFRALDALEFEPPADGFGIRSRSVGNTPAQSLDTRAGEIVISRDEPYRVLRLEPPAGSQPGASGTADTASFATSRPVADAGEDGGLFDGVDTQALEVDQVTESESPKMYDRLEKGTKELSKAGDGGVALSLNGSGKVRCSSGGCTATGSFSGSLTSDAKSRLVGGKVTAVMTSTFTIDGRSGGRCTSSAGTFPVNGSSVSGSLTCSNPGAGATFASVEARKKAEARARSRANGGRPVQYSIPLRANSLISARALATVEVRKLIEGVKKERTRPSCATTRSFSAERSALGERLPAVRGAEGPRATAITRLDQQRRAPGLSVAGLHTTRYVPAGETLVLIGNNGGNNCNPISRKQSDDIAKALGYTNTKRRSVGGSDIWKNKKAKGGQPVSITWDRNGHKGGIFKGSNDANPFQSTRDSARDGTYDLDIGPKGEIKGLKWVAK